MATELKTRPWTIAPVNDFPQDAIVFTSVPPDWFRHNFAIKAAVGATETMFCLESMKFAVAFIDQAGDEITDGHNV